MDWKTTWQPPWPPKKSWSSCSSRPPTASLHGGVPIHGGTPIAGWYLKPIYNGKSQFKWFRGTPMDWKPPNDYNDYRHLIEKHMTNWGILEQKHVFYNVFYLLERGLGGFGHSVFWRGVDLNPCKNVYWMSRRVPKTLGKDSLWSRSNFKSEVANNQLKPPVFQGSQNLRYEAKKCVKKEINKTNSSPCGDDSLIWIIVIQGIHKPEKKATFEFVVRSWQLIQINRLEQPCLSSVFSRILP